MRQHAGAGVGQQFGEQFGALAESGQHAGVGTYPTGGAAFREGPGEQFFQASGQHPFRLGARFEVGPHPRDGMAGPWTHPGMRQALAWPEAVEHVGRTAFQVADQSAVLTGL